MKICDLYKEIKLKQLGVKMRIGMGYEKVGICEECGSIAQLYSYEEIKDFVESQNQEENHSQRKEGKGETQDVPYLETRNKTEEEDNVGCKTVDVDNHADTLSEEAEQ